MKPGQLKNVNDVIVRVKIAESGCKGCFFERKISCPCMKDSRSEFNQECRLNGFIYVKP